MHVRYRDTCRVLSLSHLATTSTSRVYDTQRGVVGAKVSKVEPSLTANSLPLQEVKVEEPPRDLWVKQFIAEKFWFLNSTSGVWLILIPFAHERGAAPLPL